MKKIMFNDRFGLTDAVLQGVKTVTRRIVTDKILEEYDNYDDWCLSVGTSGCGSVERQYNNLPEFIIGERWLSYQVGEIVAIAQCYDNIIETLLEPNGMIRAWIPESAGFRNKMFVKASLMPHQIEIIDARIERLQDITDEDCIKEGIKRHPWEDGLYWCEGLKGDFSSPREAFVSLIDKVAKKGTWDSNPYVFRNEFKLIK